jgi:hypothetical protein
VATDSSLPITNSDLDRKLAARQRSSQGCIDLFSTDALIDMLARLGVIVGLTVKICRAA